MPIGFGIGATHNNWIIRTDPEEWQEGYISRINGKPQPRAAELETVEVIQTYIDRVQASLRTLKAKLAEYDPELIVVIGGDQTEMFDRSNVPNLMMYVGEEVFGHITGGTKDDDLFHLRVDVETSRRLLDKLVRQEEFDIAFSTEFSPQARPESRVRGLSHAFCRPTPMLMPRPEVPTVLIWENTYDPPSLSAVRCYELGRAIARLLAHDPRRIAIVGSGGLSHDPSGPRSGWIDRPLDEWFLDQIRNGNGRATTAMYGFDSLTMRSGTGEMRAWITTAGAMEQAGARAQVVDYIPAHHAVTGMGFAYWRTANGSASKGAER